MTKWILFFILFYGLITKKKPSHHEFILSVPVDGVDDAVDVGEGELLGRGEHGVHPPRELSNEQKLY